MAHTIHYAMAQVLNKRGLKTWDKLADDAVSKDMNQFHMVEAILTVDISHMT